MTKRFESVAGMVEGLSSDEKFKEEISKELKNKNIAKLLFTLRCERNLTQKQLAERIQCTQSRVSKIEGSCDKELSVRDLLDYGKALNLQLEVGYRNRGTKIVDLIKYHAFRIKDYFERLDDLVKKDETLAKNILGFHLEAYVNLSRFILKSIPTLHKKTLKPEKEAVHISVPLADKLEKEEHRELLRT